MLPAKNLYIALLADDEYQTQPILTFPYYNDEKIRMPSSRVLGNGLTELTINTALPTLIAKGEIYSLSEQGEITKQPLTLNYPKDKMPQSWLASPLMEDGEIFGVLATQHYQNAQAYQHSDLALIRFISQHVATAILRKRAQADIEKNNEKLEKIVNQRTQELQASNLNLRMQIEERKKSRSPALL